LYYIPNTFTPDGDEVNQTFLPIFSSGIDIYEFTLLIFNRWGALIFESHDASKGWNGRYGNEGDLVQDDTYVWKILYKEKNSQQRHVEVGHVNVLK
jgi:gliding motility-associated-like protein